MDDFERYMEEKRRKEEEERKAFFKKCAGKVTDGEAIYHMLGLSLCERFRLELEWNGSPPYVVWNIVNYFVEEVDEDWFDWLQKDDAPMIRPIDHLQRVFPELTAIRDDPEDVIDLANRLYGLELDTDGDCCDCAEYFFAYSFDFNSFKPLPIKEIKTLKTEKEILEKYGYDTSEVEEKLSEFGLTNEELEAL